MPFDQILGQQSAVETLRRALASGRVHHAYRFEGPSGVGKELVATALAQALLCPNSQLGCGACSACRRVVTCSQTPPCVPMHPDLILVGRGLYSGSLVTKKETQGISVEQVRKVVLGRAQFPPHEAQRMVFIVRDADEITRSAANALLKTLEEPRRDVHFILLTHRPQRLLDTVRSRTLAVRFGPLPEQDVATILRRHDLDPELAPLSQGSAATALELADDARLGQRREFTTQLQGAVAAPDLGPALKLAGSLPRERRELREQLLSYGQQLALQARSLVHSQADQALQAAQRYSAVQRTLDALEANASPALAVEALVVELRSS